MEKERLMEFTKEELVEINMQSDTRNAQLVAQFNELRETCRRLSAFRDTCAAALNLCSHDQYTDTVALKDLVTEAGRALGYTELPDPIGL